MALNDKNCSSCSNYAVISIGDGQKKARHGWCVPRSKYPAKEQPGQIFPPGAKRVAVGELAKPFIVVGDDVMPNCGDYRAKPPSKPTPKKK